jgi:thioredoxin-like negative regulator of GroEL
MTEKIVKIGVFGGLIILIFAALFLPDWLKSKEKDKALAMVFQGKPVVLEFTSPTCGVCKEMKPLVEKLKKEYQGKVNFVVVSTDSTTGEALRDKFPVEYVPSFYLMIDEHNQFDHFEGAVPEPMFRTLLDGMLKKSGGDS